MNETTVRPGRPAVYSGEIAQNIVNVIKSTDTGNGANLTIAHKILTAKNGAVGVSKVEKQLAAQRKAAGFEKPLEICKPTLRRLAQNAGVEIRGRGRPKFKTEAA